MVSRTDVQALEDRTNAWIEKAANPEINARREMNQFKTTIDDIAAMMKNGKGKTLMDASRVKLKMIVDAEEVLIDRRNEDQRRIESFIINFTVIGTLAAIFLGSLIAFFVTRGVVTPIKQTNDLLANITDGDFTQRIPLVSDDEIGEMDSNLDTLTAKLQLTISQICDSSTHLTSAADELVAVTEQTNAGVNNQNRN